MQSPDIKLRVQGLRVCKVDVLKLRQRYLHILPRIVRRQEGTFELYLTVVLILLHCLCLVYGKASTDMVMHIVQNVLVHLQRIARHDLRTVELEDVFGAGAFEFEYGHDNSNSPRNNAFSHRIADDPGNDHDGLSQVWLDMLRNRACP